MTPQEIVEYKQRWMRNCYSIRIHKDLRSRAKDWCAERLHTREWKFGGETEPYVDTFHFESQYHSQQFAQEFFPWIQK